MALSLDKVRKSKNRDEHSSLDKNEKILKPWESFNEKTKQVSSTRAYEAYLKAQKRENEEVEVESSRLTTFSKDSLHHIPFNRPKATLWSLMKELLF